jgi:hypothetical protein
MITYIEIYSTGEFIGFRGGSVDAARQCIAWGLKRGDFLFHASLRQGQKVSWYCAANN